MKNSAYFTVIITAYNIEKYICDCIKSVQNQSFSDFKCIIVDDGSSDKTASVIADSIKNDSRFQSFTISHGGPQRAKSAGLEKACGEYVIFVDGDDTLESECLADCSEKTADCDLLIFGINYQQYKNGNLFGEKQVSLQTMEFTSGAELADWYIRNGQLLLYSNANKFYRRQTLKNYGIHFRDDMSFGEDRLFNFDFLRVCKRIRTIPGVYYNYRVINEGSLTHSFKHHFIDILLMLHDEKINCLCGLSEKTTQREKEKFIRDNYDGSFDVAFDLLQSKKDSLSDSEYSEELAYLEARFAPSVYTVPYYFFLNHAWMSKKKRVSDFAKYIRSFKTSDAFRSLIAALDGAAQKTENIKRRCECEDDYTFLCQFGTRNGERQQSLESPATLKIENLLFDKKEQIYHALYDLGFIDNITPHFDHYDYILILGGANDANRLRTVKAKEIADKLISKGEKPKLIAGLSTYRQLSEAEHKTTDKYASYTTEYEFDVISRCIENELFTANGVMAKQLVCHENNDSDLSFSSKIIEFSSKYNGCPVRVYCAPKNDPNVQRADAKDCMEFFLSNCEVPEGSNVLLITSNCFCISNFKPEVWIEHRLNADIIGNYTGKFLISPETISCSQYINEFIKFYAEFNRFEAEYC